MSRRQETGNTDNVEQRRDERLEKRQRWLAYQMRITPMPARYEALYKCGAESLDTTISSKRGWDKASARWLARRSNAFADFVVWGR